MERFAHFFSTWSLIKQSLAYFIAASLGLATFTFPFGISVILLYVSQVCLFQIFSSVTHYLVQQL